VAGDVIDSDTIAAVRTTWRTDNAVLPTLLTEAPQSGRLKTGQGPTYAVVSCEKGRDRQRNTFGVFQDFRNVAITVRGTKASVEAVVAAAGAVFNDRTVLVFPSGAKFLGWLATDQKVIEDPDTKEGQDIWQGIITAEVWSVRSAA
jgi:hypothetical protein